MRGDKKILKEMMDLREMVDSYIGFVESYNTCAYTDRILEQVTEKAANIKALHEKQFKSI